MVEDCVGAILLLTKEGELTREGPTAVGGVKNEPSSSVSKKSLKSGNKRVLVIFGIKQGKRGGHASEWKIRFQTYLVDTDTERWTWTMRKLAVVWAVSDTMSLVFQCQECLNGHQEFKIKIPGVYDDG